MHWEQLRGICPSSTLSAGDSTWGVASPVLGCPAQLSCRQTAVAPAQARRSCSEMVLQHVQEAIPDTATSFQCPSAAQQPPCARVGCYPAQDQQGWPAASHCRANEEASPPCSLLLAAPWAHQGYSLPRWEINREWQLLTRFYSAVGSWPGVEGEDVKCCGSKLAGKLTPQGCVFLSLCGLVTITPESQRHCRLFLCLPH